MSVQSRMGLPQHVDQRPLICQGVPTRQEHGQDLRRGYAEPSAGTLYAEIVDFHQGNMLRCN